MTVTADQLRELITLGLEGEKLIAAVAIFERDATVTHHVETRSKEAIRSERYRAKRKKNKGAAKANDVTATGVVERDANRDASRLSVTGHCDLSSSFLSKGTPKTGSKKEGVARGTRLSSEVLLSDADRKFATDNGVSNPDALWAEFIDFWIGVPGQRGTKLNWSATWRNRVRAVSTKHGKANVVRPSESPARADFRDAIAELKTFNRGAASGGESGGNPVRLLRPAGGG